MDHKQISYNQEKLRIEFHFPFSMGMKNKIKALPDARFDGEARLWWLPASEYSAKMSVKFGKEYGFLIDKPVLDLGKDPIFSKSNLVRSKMYPFQIKALDFLHNTNGRAIIADEMGLGKLQPIDSQVLTPYGWRMIGEIKIGDHVIGSDGQPHRVTGVFPQGKKDVYRVTFSDNSSVESGLEHLWTMRYRMGGDHWEELVLTTEQLKNLPCIIQSKTKKVLNLSKTALYLPMLTAPVEFATVALPIPPYTLGYLLASGNLTQSSVVASTHSDDVDQIRSQMMQEGMDCSYSKSYTGKASRFWVRGLIGMIQHLGLDILSANKFIPDIYLLASPSQRVSLLHGLMDGDGSVSLTRNKVIYHSISHKLALGVQELVEGLGGVASVNTYDRAGEDKPVEYQIRMCLPEWVLPFTVERKAIRYVPGSHARPTRTMKSVEFSRNVASVCISVDSEDHLYVTEHAILTHNTIEALGYIQERGFHSILIVSPASVTYKWQDEIKNWTGEDSAVITSSSEPLPNAKFTIMSYAIFTRKIESIRARGYQLSLFDESHALANKDSQRTRAAKSLNTPYFLGLSGTPFLNRPIELFPQLNIISPGRWNSYWKYAITYCGAYKSRWGWDVSGASHLKELKQELAPYFLRRTKQEVMSELPSMTRVNIPVDYDKLFARDYSNALTDARRQVQENRKASKLELVAKLRQIIGHMKVGPAVELAENVLVSKQKVVLFAHHKAVVATLVEKLKHFGVITIVGDTPQHERSDNVFAFLHDPQVRVAIISQAGGEGIDLFSADTLIFVEREWNPGKEGQIEARLHRIGQQSNVEIIYLVARHTMDERIHKLIETKREIFGQLISIDDIPVMDLLEI